MISVPIQPSNTKISSLFSSVAGKYAAVYSYDGTGYQYYIPGTADNTISDISPGNGYWVLMDGEGRVAISGTAAPSTVHLRANWNLTGYNSLKASSVTDALKGTGNNVQAVYTLASDGASYKSYPGDLSTLEPGRAYWIYSSGEVDWTIAQPSAPQPGPSPRAQITASFIGQSILHKPGSAGTKPTGKNLFYYFLEWGNGKTKESHYTISGAGLMEHFKNNTTNSIIKQGNDYFVMCEGTKYYWTRKRTESDAKDLGERARKAGSIPVIYIPYAHNGSSSEPYFKTDEVMKVYMDVAAKLQMPFIPVAYAIGEAVKAFGAGKIFTDEVHLNSDGQFLAGCVTWATLMQTPVSAIEYKGDTKGLSLNRDTMVRICRDTITKYPPDARLLAGGK